MDVQLVKYKVYGAVTLGASIIVSREGMNIVLHLIKWEFDIGFTWNPDE